jgi:protein-S-isoprenylcysteine O-methyltransferase Ste14
MVSDRMKQEIMRFAGFIVFLVQSVPVWTGLMTLPFAVHLILILTNLSDNLPLAISEFLSPFLIPEKVFIIIGVMTIIYSIIHLQTKKKEGLVTTGPYRIVRHPQYLGMIISTLGFTSWSLWWLQNTFGIGFLNPSQTIGLWFGEIFAYIILAKIEENYLTKTLGESYENYRRQVPFLIPLYYTENTVNEIIISVIVPALLLFALIILN